MSIALALNFHFPAVVYDYMSQVKTLKVKEGNGQKVRALFFS